MALLQFKSLYRSITQKIVKYPILFTMMLGLACMIVVVMTILELSKEIKIITAADSASELVKNMETLRQFYADRIINNLKSVPGVIVTHDYYQKQGTIPPPARFAIDVAEAISNTNGNLKVKLLSQYPFPWRYPNHEQYLDNFELTSIQYFNNKNLKPIYRLETHPDGDVLRYVEPILMTPGCVSCHNSHPESPKRDWKIGDVRGISEVFVTLANLDETIKSHIAWLLFAFLSLLLIALTIIYMALSKLKSTNRDLEKIVEKRTHELMKQKTRLEDTITHLEQAHETIATQEKLASLGRMAAGIAHEIKNPLNFIKNFTEIVDDSLGDLTKDRNCSTEMLETVKSMKFNVNKIIEHCHRIDKIIKSMQSHSRTGIGVIESVNVNELLQQTIHLVQHGRSTKTNRKQIDFVYAFDPSQPLIMAFTNELARVLLNLLTNAVYAVEERCAKEGDEYNPLIKVTTKNEQNAITVSIFDNGTGIDTERLHRIFEPFYTTKPSTEGTGLGLSLSYDIITKMHKGTIKVRSQQGEYAEFLITLPKIID